MEFLDSFDDRVTADLADKYTSKVESSVQFVPTITASAGRNGGNGLRLTRSASAATVEISLVLSVPNATRYKIAFARRWSTLPPATEFRTIASMRDSGTTQVNLRLNSDGTLEMVRGSAGSAITGGKSVLTIAAGDFHHFEWDVTINNTTGAGQLIVDGVTSFFSFTGQNTRITANNQANETIVRNVPSSTGDTSFTDDIDDVIIHDGAAFVGDLRIGIFNPTGAGTYSEWDANGAATLWEAVDDTAQDGDTTYASTAVVGEKQTFAFSDIPITADISFVQHVWVAKKTDAGPKEIKRRTKSDSTESTGTAFALTTSYARYRQMENVDPDTGIAWTAAGFNSAEFGDEVVS